MKGSHISISKSQNFERLSKKSVQLFLAVSTLLLISQSSLFISPADAATGINKTINFQGKLTNSDGTNVANSTYSVVFTLYDASSGGTNLWTETQSVTTTAGIFQVALGSVNTNLANVNFNSDTIYLGIKVGTDSEMTPRIRFAAVPYALNAAKLGGMTATQSATGFTLQGGSSSQSTASFTTSGGALVFQPGVAEGLTIQSNGANGLTFDTGGGAAITIGNNNATSVIFGNTTSNPSFSFNGTGGLTIANGGNNNITLGSSSGNGTVVIQPNAGGQAGLIVNDQGSGDLFTASAAGATKFTITNAGAVKSANYVTNTGVLYTDATGLFKQTSSGSDGNCLVISGTTPGWGSCVTGGGQDLAQTTASLNNTTLLGTSTLIGTVSVTPTTTTGDIWVQVSLWTNSLSNTNQTITWELRSGSNCSGSLLTSQTSALTSANASDGPAGFLSYVTTNPGISQQNYAVCGLSSVASGVSAGGIATATVLDNTGPQGIQGPAGPSDWQVTSLGVITPNNPTTDLLLGSTATASARFAVINIASGTTTASISAGAAGGIYITAAGTITTTANQSLILGNSTSGHVILNPLNRMYVGIGTTAPVATLDVRGNTGLAGGTIPVASLSGKTSFASLLIDNSGVGDIFTASTGGVSKFTISNAGTITSSNYTLNGGLLYTNSAGQFLQLGDVGIGFCLNSAGVGAVPTWGACGTNYWQITNGTIAPFSNTLDLLVGATATNSAKFAVLNVNSGTPTATVAGNLVINPYTSGTSQLGGNLTVGGVQGFANAVANFGGSVNNFLQVNNQNRSNGASASTDFVATNDLGTDTTNYIDFGINSSGYNDAAYTIGGANDGYLYNNGGDLTLGTQTAGKVIKFHAGGTLSTNEVFRLSGIGTTSTASVAAATTFAGFVADNRGSGDIFTASSAGLNRFVIKQNGNVGIGTTTPTQKLDVNGNIRVQGLGNTNGVLYTDSTGLVQQTTTGGAGTLCLTSANGGTPVFGSCSGTASTIWSSLSAPSTNLSLSMSTNTSTFNWATGTGSNNLFSFTTDSSANGTGALLNLATGNSSTVAPLNISAAGRQAFYVTANGTIGVGTTTVGNGELVVNQSNSAGDIFSASQSGNTKFVITNNGTVGIGTNATLGTFDVRGSSGTAPAATVSANSSFAGLIVNNVGSGDIFTASSSGATRLTVQQNGQIVIGANGVGSQLVASNNGIEFTESDTNPTCAAGNFNIYADLSENKLKKCQNGTITDLAPALADMQSFTTYDSSEALVAVPTTLVVSIATVSATPTSSTGDVYIRGKIQYSSGSNTDQTFTMSLRKNTCSGPVISSNVLTITSASGANIGDFELAGVDVNPGTGTTNYILCGSVTGATTNIIWHEVFAQVVDNGADYAELYTTSDETLGAGDVIALDNTLKAGVKKTQKAYDPAVMGIVATRPGQVIGGVDQEGVKAVPIALAGRVPVKVSTESGTILPGDFLTPSSIPGVAMKAIQPGFVIGQAMTGYGQDGVGTVMTFVRNQWYDPGVSITSLATLTVESTQSATDSSQLSALIPTVHLTDTAGEAITRVGAFAQAAIGNIKIGYGEAQAMTIDGYLNVKENITAGVITTGEITTNSLIITSENVSIGTLTLHDYIANVVREVLDSYQIPHVQVATTATVPGLLTQQSGEKLFKQLLAENVLGASTSAALAPAPDASEIASSSAVANTDELALKSLNVAGLATISSTLRVKQNGLVEGILTVVDTLMTKNLVVSGISTFFDSVVFKGDVAFKNAPTFSNNTAGFAIIKKDSDQVEVVFDKPYEKTPVVNISISLDETPTPTPNIAEIVGKTTTEPEQTFDQKVLASDLSYIVTKRTKKGFTILLNKPADDDISFSWTALVVDDPQTFESKQPTPTPTPSALSSSPAGGNLQGEEVITHEGTH